MDENSQSTIVASFIIDKELHKRIKLYAVENGMKLKDVLDLALREFLKSRKK